MGSLRILTEKVGIVQNFGWEFSVNFKPCYVMLIPTLRATLRQLFLGMVKIALYLHGSYFPREHSVPSACCYHIILQSKNFIEDVMDSSNSEGHS